MAMKLYMLNVIEDEESLQAAIESVKSTSFTSLRCVFYENKEVPEKLASYISTEFSINRICLDLAPNISALFEKIDSGESLLLGSSSFIDEMKSVIPSESIVSSHRNNMMCIEIPIEHSHIEPSKILDLRQTVSFLSNAMNEYAIVNKNNQQAIDKERSNNLLATELYMSQINQNFEMLGPQNVGETDFRDLQKLIAKTRSRCRKLSKSIRNNPETFEFCSHIEIVNPRRLRHDMLQCSVKLKNHGAKMILSIKNNTQFFFSNLFIREKSTKEVILPRKFNREIYPDCPSFYPKPVGPGESFKVKLDSPYDFMDMHGIFLMKINLIYNSVQVSKSAETGSCSILLKGPYSVKLIYHLSGQINAHLCLFSNKQLIQKKDANLRAYSELKVKIDEYDIKDKTFIAVYYNDRRISSRLNLNF